MDSSILTLVSRDLVATESHCHRSCYRLYTKEEISKETASSNKRDEDDEAKAHYDADVHQSYNNCFFSLGRNFFIKPQVINMAELSYRMVASVNSLGITQVNESAKKHVGQKLESEVAESLHILFDDKENSSST